VTYDDSSERSKIRTHARYAQQHHLGLGGGYGTRIRYGAHANVVTNYYDSDGGSGTDALIIARAYRQISVLHDTTNVARAYVSGNYSGDGVNLNNRGTQSSPFPADPVDTQDAQAAACQVLEKCRRAPPRTHRSTILARIFLPDCANSPRWPTLGPTRRPPWVLPFTFDGRGSSDPDGDPSPTAGTSAMAGPPLAL